MRKIGDLDLSAGPCRLEVRPSRSPGTPCWTCGGSSSARASRLPGRHRAAPARMDNACSCNALAANPLERNP